MPTLATSSTRFSAVVKHEYQPTLGFCRDTLTVNETAALTYPVGTVLGLVTATGKYKRVEASAVDGSQVAAAIVIADALGNSGDIAVAAATDTKVLAITRGPVIVADAGLTFGASVSTTPLLATAYGQLKTIGVLVQAAI